MRPAFLPAFVLAALVMSGAPGRAGPVALTCPEPGNAVVAQVCAALQDELRQSGHSLLPAADAPLRLRLEAESQRPDRLRARLIVEDASGRHDGDEIELSVMDRATIPEAQLRSFARLLLGEALSRK